MDMTADAIKAIADLKRPEKISVGNVEYIIKGYDEAIPPTIETLTCHTLTGIVDFVSENIDGNTNEKLMIHIQGHEAVGLISAATSVYRRREMPLKAIISGSKFKFGEWYPVDEFVIAINSAFVENEDRIYLQSLMGSLTQGSSKNISDNGATQTTTVKSGVSFIGEHAIKNPLKLKPFRTFLEIDQPESEFLFRIKKNQRDDDGLPMCSLFEADGGAWKLAAIQSIKSYFADNLSEIAVVA